MSKNLLNNLIFYISSCITINQWKYILIILSSTILMAEEIEQQFIYASPLYLKTNKWEEKASTILGVELQKYVIKKKMPWRKLDYSSDTALVAWYQKNVADTIRSLPNNFISNLKGCLLVLVYNLSGSERDIEKDPKIYPKVGGIGINTLSGDGDISGDLNKYDNIFYSLSVFDTSGNAVITLRVHTSDIDDAVKSIVESSSHLELKGKVKAYKGQLPKDTSGVGTKFQLGQALFITGSVMTFAGFGVIVSGTSDDAKAAGFTLYSIGQAGLILCGSSNLIMRSALMDATGLNYSISPKGYILFGSGLALFGGGLALVGAGIKNNAGPLIITGITSISTGQVLSAIAWIPFIKDYKRMNRKFKKLNISPSVSVSSNGTIGIGIKATF